MPNILITRPLIKGDEATNHTFYWAETIVQKAKKFGYSLVDIKKDDVTYINVSNKIKVINPDVYIHFGHGCPANLLGQSECIITNGTKNFDSTNLKYLQNYSHRFSYDISCDSKCKHNKNVGILKDKIVIAYACHSAKRLGVCAMMNGAKAYIGFNDYLIFMVDTKETEKIFTDCLLTFTHSLLQGDTIKVSKEKTLYMFDMYIKHYKNVGYLPKLLLWDREEFTVLGDQSLTIFG